ncbi:hypothetical protein XhyaCFBP1156_19700 [Xanthomonas hyacinthi]|uniref:Uncharacterized protein n=2 Tax=Xanthomonas hyacinthi TaxID=56455 RepID=A0A2S7EPX5_9XANT|nr:hypothetical protein Y886_27130 [Xanthomonas hyacinthi DSM 19077]PPU95161.1 hypothetical protein XhyaCFBP1156_19700 [Xanthomonas hyacinthi]
MISALVLLAACSKVNLEWSEEVRLADGSTLIVDRTATGEKKYEIGGPGGWNQTQMSLRIGPGGTKPPPVWRDAFVPLLLDYEPATGTWSLVTSFYFCSTWYELGKPGLPYIEFQSREGRAWARVPLESRLIGRESNLLTGPDADGEHARVTIKDKLARERNTSERLKKIASKWNGC